MARIRDLVDERTRERLAIQARLDAEAEEIAADHQATTPGADPVSWWPSDKLDVLLAARPELEGEILRRRPEVTRG